MCLITYFDVKQTVLLKEMSSLYVWLENSDIIVEEEYTLQDFSAIVATLGGSIGIFLGWSLLDLCRLLAHFLKRFFVK